ncbi:ATP-dependent RNA helicase dhx36 [Phtheirospermum japonicum]|uniref:RNA helicase n=1 Tax=Phtheirospermum japonicum TaxID=374723 RepID=A0A830BPT1_9LAMI|nr:ATP-dependent RNA helicase dhx36 [Phtheirospermum japonicum]
MPSSSMFAHNYFKLKLRAMSVAHLTYPPKSLSSIATSYRRLHNLYPQTDGNIILRGFAFTCFASSSSVRARRHGNVSSTISFPLFYQHKLGYGGFAYDEYVSDEESDSEFQSSPKQLGASTLDNVEDWRIKLTSLVRRKDEQELVSRDKKDRRDFEQLSALAARMGLHSRQYEKVVVFSKVPLPNYRSDLDTKRPQREVMLPFGLQKAVASHLRAHLSRKAVNKDNFPHDAILTSDAGQSQLLDERFDVQEEPSTRSVVAERIFKQRSLQMHNKQQEWQESTEGQKMLEFRRSLPAHKERDTLLNTISQNQVVVVSGETGCGKTTQLPQYILESEIEAARGAACSIICTQPRRISAISVAERVAAERGEKIGESVGYRVRLEGMKGRDTRLLFCTTGILLRRLLVDRNLKGTTHVIVDEIHERGMNEDFLLIVLKDLLRRRPELRLILMSATLNAELFSSYFGGAPMIHIPGFTYPVRCHFLENILETTGYRLTPYNQIDNYGQDKMWKMQKQTLRKRKTQIASSVEEALMAANFREYSPRVRESLSSWNPDSIGFNLIEHVLCHICQKERPGAVLVFMTGWDDINSLKDQLQAHPLLGDPSKVLLLACHGSMASAEQEHADLFLFHLAYPGDIRKRNQVYDAFDDVGGGGGVVGWWLRILGNVYEQTDKLIFDKPQDGVRKIVLATNMAETSITINDVVFVVDCGKAKETSYDALNNTPCLLPSWISKASARQRKGRAGRVQPGECYHLYPRCVHDAFADYQLPELLRTPLQSLCLQIKSLQLGSISDFLSKALQPPEPLSVQNAIEYLKMIGALDENENLSVLGQKLSVLPVEPKLGKMLIYGALFNCLDPIMTIVAGLSVRDPFLMPFDKKDLAESAKAHFSGRDFSDHITLVRAFEGWKEAERQQYGYEYCWRNFLSTQTLKAIDSLKKQFLYLLKDNGVVEDIESCNKWSRDEHLIRAVLCAGLFPGICSVVNKEKSISLKTMEDGGVLLHSSSVNSQETKIPFPWLVFNEKVKVNSVFLRDSTGVSDSVVLLFGGNASRGGLDGYMKMLGGYLEFFMTPDLAAIYLNIKRELDELVQKKLLNPKLDMECHNELLTAVRLLVSEDRCEGRFVFGRQISASSKKAKKDIQPGLVNGGGNNQNSKTHLQTMLARAGHQPPSYKTKPLKNNKFKSTVMFNGLDFVGQPCGSKKEAEKDAAAEALRWLTGDSQSSEKTVDYMSTILKKSKKKSQSSDARWR